MMNCKPVETRATISMLQISNTSLRQRELQVRRFFYILKSPGNINLTKICMCGLCLRQYHSLMVLNREAVLDLAMKELKSVFAEGKSIPQYYLIF